jgi:hypothetical protein
MRESVEFRIDERFAHLLFADNEGTKLVGVARKITIASDDPRFSRIGELQEELQEAKTGSFFYGWRFLRRYTPEELERAELLELVVTTAFEPAGEECGTRYDESTACPKCGSGAKQASDLWLDLRKLPKGKDIASTIAGEWVVSQHLAELMIDAGLTGFDLRRVRHRAHYEDDALDLRRLAAGRELLEKAEDARCLYPEGKFHVWINRAENTSLWEKAQAEHAALQERVTKQRRKVFPVWYQLVTTNAAAEITSPTRVGNTPFDDDSKGEYRCPLGDLIGLNLLSEVSISAATRGENDIICTRQYIGMPHTGIRRGLLRPRQVTLISPKFWRLLSEARIKGINIEVAHLV